MHYVCEVLLPPMPEDKVKSTLETVLAPFSENQEPDEDGYTNPHTFWDWWVIGGRWAGSKLIDSLDPEKIEAFYQDLRDMKTTVSSITAGKQQLSPESQIPAVDATWKKYFPEWDACPLFSHYHNQYSEEGSAGDIMKLKDVPEGTSCETLLITAMYERDDRFVIKAEQLLMKSIWNGVSFQDTTFDGKVLPAIQQYREKIGDYRKEFAELNYPTEDWLLVTVDYHN